MRRQILLAALLLTVAISAVAQKINYSNFVNKTYFTAIMDGSRVKISNSLKVQLPTSVNNDGLPVKNITSAILANSFPQISDKSIVKTLTTPEAVKAYMRNHLLDSDMSPSNLRPMPSTARGAEYDYSTEVEVTEQCVSNGILTISISTSNCFGGPSVNYGKSYAYIRLSNGEEVKASELLSSEKKAKILAMLENVSDVKKYSSDKDIDDESAEEIARGVKDLERNTDNFPCFYIDNGTLHLTFQPYAVASEALGMPEFDIPMSIFADAAKPKTPTTAADAGVFDTPERNASFPGGDQALYQYLAQNMHYPSQAAKQGAQGRVLVQFIVDTNGDIIDVKVMKSPNEELSKEAIRLVKSMPKWVPARQGDKVVKSRFTLPVMFRLVRS